jgi:hypothetical protein
MVNYLTDAATPIQTDRPPHTRLRPAPARDISFVSVVLPCLNEEAGVGQSVDEARAGLERAGVPGEVIVVDNGSTDGSQQLAAAAGATVVSEERRGYGAAHLAGIAAARGDVVVMADADCTYDLLHLDALLAPLRDGADMVVASRIAGAIAGGAMPPLHRYIGTPAITRLLNSLTGVPLSDSQSGYRAFRKSDIERLGLRASGMEYASEMLLKAGRAGFEVREVPTAYRQRVGESKLNTLGDGWRHIQMLLLLSPHLTLIVPGLVALAGGLLLCLLVLVFPKGLPVGSLTWPPVFLGPMLMMIGAQAAFLGAIAADRSALTPERVKQKLLFLERPNAVNWLLSRYALTAVLGSLVDLALFFLWVGDRSGTRLVGAAGLAQALIVIGISGIVTIFAVDYSRERLGW